MLLCFKLVNLLYKCRSNVVQFRTTIVQIVPILKGKYQLSSCKFIDGKDI